MYNVGPYTLSLPTPTEGALNPLPYPTPPPGSAPGDTTLAKSCLRTATLATVNTTVSIDIQKPYPVWHCVVPGTYSCCVGNESLDIKPDLRTD